MLSLFVIIVVIGSLKVSAQQTLDSVVSFIKHTTNVNPATTYNNLYTSWRYHGEEQGNLGYVSNTGNCYFLNKVGGIIIGSTKSTSNIIFLTNSTEKMRIDPNGNVGIGTTNTYNNKLAVAGNILAEKVKVKLQANWPDYVFDPAYKLPSLQELEAYVRIHKHLPDVPSAKEVAENGIDLGDTQAILLKKIEELTLLLIEQNKKLESQETRLKLLEKK